MKKERLYIAYGSNLNLLQMSKRCPTATVVGTSKVKGFELLFRGGHTNAVATIEPSEGTEVPVLVWDIGKFDEISLDRYEGYPFFYRKEMIDIELDGETRSAMVYVMNDGHDFGDPSEIYLNTIAEGYESAGFDTDFLYDAVEKSMELAEEQESGGIDYEDAFEQKM